MKDIKYKVGDLLILEILKPIKGNSPIARTKDGIICLINNRSKPGKEEVRCDVGSFWRCEIVEIKEKCLIIEAFQEDKSIQQDQEMAIEKAKELWGKKETKKERKQGYNYKYLASYEKRSNPRHKNR